MAISKIMTNNGLLRISQSQLASGSARLAEEITRKANKAAGLMIQSAEGAAAQVKSFQHSLIKAPNASKQIKKIHHALIFLRRLQKKVEAVHRQAPSLNPLKLHTSIDCSTQVQVISDQEIQILRALRKKLGTDLASGLEISPLNSSSQAPAIDSSGDAMALHLLKQLKALGNKGIAGELFQLTKASQMGSCLERDLEQASMDALHIKKYSYHIDEFSSEIMTKAKMYDLRLLLKLDLAPSDVGQNVLAHLGTGSFLIHLAQDGGGKSSGIPAVLLRNTDSCFLYDPSSGLYDLNKAESPSKALSDWMEGYNFSRLRVLHSL